MEQVEIRVGGGYNKLYELRIRGWIRQGGWNDKDILVSPSLEA